MKKISLFIYIIFFGFFLFPSLVSAECSDLEIQNLTKLASNIKSKYEHIEDNKFKITFYNIPSDLYLNSNGNVFASSSDNATVTKEGFFGGNTYKFSILSKIDSKCGFINVKNEEVKLPKFNPYSKKEECQKDKYKDLEVCSEFIDKDLTEEEFNAAIKNVDTNIGNSAEKEENGNDMFHKILNILFMPYVYISLIIIILTVVIIIIRNNKKKVF